MALSVDLFSLPTSHSSHKHCYDTIRGPKKQKLSSAQKEVQAAMAGDTLVKIIKVLGKR